MRIEKNTICYTSELGHNNFWYPTAEKVMAKKGCQAQRMPWISGGTKIPIKILKSCLVPVDITARTTNNISPPTKNEYTIVWIEKMFKKLKEICTFKKEKQMSTTETRAVKNLKAMVKEQEEKISSLRGRLAGLIDEVHMLKGEINNFKQNVANDVEYLTNRIDG